MKKWIDVAMLTSVVGTLYPSPFDFWPSEALALLNGAATVAGRGVNRVERADKLEYGKWED